MSRRSPKNFAPEFKEQVLKMVESSDKPIPVIAEEFGISAKNIYNWRKRSHEKLTSRDKDEILEVKEENKRLKKKLAQLEEEQAIFKKGVCVLREIPSVRYAFIQAHSKSYSVESLCRVLDVSRSGFYGWLNRTSTSKAEENQLLEEWIAEIFKVSRSTYGTRRIRKALNEHGVRVSRRRVSRIKRKLGLVCKAQKRYKVVTTDSNHALPIAPNLLDRQFDTERPDNAYVGDITYIPTKEGWLYLAVWIDLYSRAVVGWSMADHMKAELVTDALRMAFFKRRPEAGLIVHSDRGSQYASELLRKYLDERGYTQSMSRRGNCWDNAPAESFFHTLKVELVSSCDFKTRDEAKQIIFEYIEVFYNRKRKHSSIGYMSPSQYEIEWFKSA
ncbi:IS3-like element ISMasp3 family transposase [Magnetococcus marinus]|uniref:IS3-like element ISMasp3 family transposase n=1 Tax=Magnetococcus marinus TaxID=1124597 RepID=UPI000A2F0D30|nr:IS3-like element ISMasp3 family transposase [Magnetococcus marinus]